MPNKLVEIVKSFSALIVLFATVLMPLSAHAQTYPRPWRIYANVEYQVGYMGCVARIQHGQYGAFGFANIDRVTSRQGGCFLTATRVFASLGAGNGSDGVSAIAAGTERSASFIIYGSKYGLTCRIGIDVSANGTWSASTRYIEGYGTCPTTAAWIRRTG